MKNKGPFIHKFQSLSQNHYIYDVRTSRFAKVNEIVFDIIDGFGVLRFDEIVSKWKLKYREDSLKIALREIERQKEAGLFSSELFKKMLIPYDAEYLKDALRTKVGYMVLNITEVCNMRCEYCSFSGTYKYERTHSNRVMDDSVLFKALQFYLTHSRDSAVRSISIYGGEPLTSFDRIMEVKKLVGKECEIHIDTNGLLLGKKEIMEAVIKYNFYLQVSLDGPALYHDRHRVDTNNKPTFERIVNNLRMIQKESPEYYRKNIHFAVTLSPDTDLFALNEFFEDYDLVKENRILVNSVNPYDTTYFERFTENDYSLQRAQYEELRKEYIKRRIESQNPTAFERALFEKSLIFLHLRKFDEPYDTIGLNGSCIPGVRKIFVDTDGRIYPCERVSRAYNIGNLDKGIEIDKILGIAEEYLRQSEGYCINCWAAKCCGACFSHGVKNNRFDIERKNEGCEVLKSTRHNDFVTYATIMEKNQKAFDFTKDVVIG
ncbi:MAG: radical SAM protein [bacterium]